MPPEIKGRINFKPLLEKDLPMLHRWFNSPHVSEWWSIDGNSNPSLEEVTAKYSPRIAEKEHVDCYIILCGKKPIGMIQACDLDAYPEEKKTFGIEGKCTGLDLCIGEEDYVHRGLGSRIIHNFLQNVVFRDSSVECAVIDPQVENKIAIRAYEKAGFKYLRTVWYEPDHKHEAIMTLPRSAFIPIKIVESV